MSDTFSTINDENANPNKGLSIVKVRDVEYKQDINDSNWTAGPLKFAHAPAWSQDGMVRPATKTALPGTHNTNSLKQTTTLKNVQIFPPVVPYP